MILEEELRKIPGRISARLAEETNPAMVTAMMKQAMAQAFRKATVRYRQERKNAR